MSDSDIIITIKPLINAFERLGIQYYIGGSVASSSFGKARSTLDVDIVAVITIASVNKLVEEIKEIYYVSSSDIFEAIKNESSFNIIHLETILKVDIFVLKSREYDQQAFNRKQKNYLDSEEKGTPFFLAAPEDIILNKLEWYRAGGEVSERQMDDVVGVLKVQKDKINKDYLLKWATVLGIKDLLEKAFREIQ